MPKGITPSAAVVETPKRAEDTTWMEASVWTPRMVEALVHGVKGGKWYSINDKVYKKPGSAEKRRTIPHDKLIGKVKEQVTDSKLIKLLEQMLEQGIMESHKEWTPTQGTPQGGVVSPLLANIYLNELDHVLIQRGTNPTRYADDLVVLCGSKEQATETLESITQWMKDHGLMLHPSKTKIVDMNQPKAELDFLGYTFKRTDKGRIIRFPRQKSMKRIREAIRHHTKRTTGICLTEIIRRINRVTKGWYNYFSESVSPQFDEIDKFTRRRLRAILLKRNKAPRFGTGLAHQRWPNEFLTKQGLFSLKVAHASASYSATR
jgi:RNA-directed DNA polymerase